MVQRKAQDMQNPQIDRKKRHLQQEIRARGGADLRKKMKKAPLRNYMKPTSCSLARNGKSLKPSSTDSSSSSSSSLRAAAKTLIRQSGLNLTRDKSSGAAVGLCFKKNVGKATCSSALKDSKFPAALELNHGATEGEGASKVRVCPYAYCSLNGLMQGIRPLHPPPPLNSLISERRNLVKMKMHKSSFNLLEEEGEVIDKGEDDEICKNQPALSVQICFFPHEGIIVEEDDERFMLAEVDFSEKSDIESDHPMDHSREISQDELDDVMMDFLEYVEFNHERECNQENDKEEDEEEGGIRKLEIEAMHADWEEISECSQEQFSVKTSICYVTSEEEEEEDFEVDEVNSKVMIEMVDSTQSSPRPPDNKAQPPPSPASDRAEHEKELLEVSSDTPSKNIMNISSKNFMEIDANLSSRKRTADEFDTAKEFRPRPPNFLPPEPDVESEKVNLRHQMMDARRDAEEWMIDYVLQQAVMKLGPDRNRKVALLVKAFETVIPSLKCEEPLSHGAMPFNQMSFIQACN